MNNTPELFPELSLEEIVGITVRLYVPRTLVEAYRANSEFEEALEETVNQAVFDFFTCKDSLMGCKTIFTNPPFNAQEMFLEHALSLGVDVIFFVRLSFLSSIRRYRLYERYNPAYVYVYSARAHCYKDGDISKGKNMIDYCVMLWKPPYRNDTVLRWIV